MVGFLVERGHPPEGCRAAFGEQGGGSRSGSEQKAEIRLLSNRFDRSIQGSIQRAARPGWIVSPPMVVPVGSSIEGGNYVQS